MSIQVSGLVKCYDTQKAVDDVSFSLKKGEIVGFLGPNGAGKSTTLKMITGYLRPDAGTVAVCGQKVTGTEKNIKRLLGYLPESNPLYYDMYVREYLSFVAGVHKIKNKKQQIEKVIGMTGLTVESKKKIGQLSKGYKQRTGLAAALVHDPEVLILDEPTSGLDPNQIIEIRNVIKEQGKNKTVLFSSHILQEVQAICDRIIIINRGRLVADDTLDNLQLHSPANLVKITFQEALEARILQALPAVSELEQLTEHTWKIASNQPAEVRKQILQLAVEQNLNIVSMETEGSNLEDIFRSLTQNKA